MNDISTVLTLTNFLCSPLAVDVQAANRLLALRDDLLEGGLSSMSLALLRADAVAFGQRRKALPSKASSRVAAIPLYGSLAQPPPFANNPAATMFGDLFTSTSRTATAVRNAADDDEIESILLDVDSPGGSIFGITELADAIYA